MTTVEETEDYPIAKQNRRRRKESEKGRMRVSGRSVLTIRDTQIKRAEEIEKSRSPKNSPSKKPKRGRR